MTQPCWPLDPAAALPRRRHRPWPGLASAMAVLGLMAGCAALAPPAPVAWPAPPLADALFQPPSEPVDTDRLFELTPAMQDFLRQRLLAGHRGTSPGTALIEQMYRADGLQLAYDDAYTRTPAQAFAQRRGNCLSLALLTAAFAKALGLGVGFQAVHDHDLTDVSGDLLLRSGHVNVLVSPPVLTTPGQFPMDRYTVTVDFLPEASLRRSVVRPLTEEATLALFQNNRAAEALLAGRLDDAYAWARAAVLAEPGLAHGLNTLGIVYQRHGQAALAEQAWRQTLLRDADHVPALGNLRDLLLAQGRADDAAPLVRRLALLEPEPPFAVLAAAQQALAQGDAARALPLLEGAARAHRESAELQFWLARAQVQLGRPEQAQAALLRALALSRRDTERSRYSAKLDWLRSQGMP